MRLNNAAIHPYSDSIQVVFLTFAGLSVFLDLDLATPRHSGSERSHFERVHHHPKLLATVDHSLGFLVRKLARVGRHVLYTNGPRLVVSTRYRDRLHHTRRSAACGIV